jgi:hypothetical protein
MIYRSISLGRSCAIIFVATTIFRLHPRSIAAQDLESKPASTDHAHLAPCSAVHGDVLQPARKDLTGNSLAGAPITAGRAQGQAQDPATPFGQQPNQLPVLPPTTRSPLTGEDKFRIYFVNPDADSFGASTDRTNAFGKQNGRMSYRRNEFWGHRSAQSCIEFLTEHSLARSKK